MKIHILTSVFFPEIHPRAFRATELAKEFSRCGHQVMVSSLTMNSGVDYNELQKEYGIHIHNLALYHSVDNSNIQQSFHSHNLILQWFHRTYRFLLEYFLAGHLFRYAIQICKNIQVDPDTDLFISSSTPFMNILAGAIYHYKHTLPHTIFIADCGDPFSGSQQNKRALYMQWLEKWALRQYDYLSVPTKAAIPAYQHVIPLHKIQIIPQGFQFSDTPIDTYKRHSIPTFAYAGVFYKDIRNPKFLLDYLTTISAPFIFKLYLRHNDPEIAVIIDSYKHILKDKLQVEYGKDRTSLIYELSQFDFLIHVGNLVATQLPSKLIDYGITKRPIFACTENSFSSHDFLNFLQGDYSNAMQIDITPYQIEQVGQQFIELSK